MADEEIYHYSPKEAERERRRERKRRPKMRISGRSVIGLAQLISRRAQEIGRERKTGPLKPT